MEQEMQQLLQKDAMELRQHSLCALEEACEGVTMDLQMRLVNLRCALCQALLRHPNEEREDDNPLFARMTTLINRKPLPIAAPIANGMSGRRKKSKQPVRTSSQSIRLFSQGVHTYQSDFLFRQSPKLFCDRKLLRRWYELWANATDEDLMEYTRETKRHCSRAQQRKFLEATRVMRTYCRERLEEDPEMWGENKKTINWFLTFHQ